MRKILALLALLLVTPAEAQNYNATAGSGLVFGSKFVTSVNYPQVVFCDPATPAQCAAIDSSGRITLVPNQSINNAQVNGVTILTGTGAVGTGAQRIAVGTDTTTIAGSAPGTAGTASTNVLSVQGIASMTKLLVTPDSVALPANQSVNVAQFGGISTSTGQVAVSTAPVTATNTALVVDLRPDSPGIVALGQTTKSASVPVTTASDQLGTTTPSASQPVVVSAGSGNNVTGSYCMAVKSGVLTAGLAANAPVISFRFGAAAIALIRKIQMTADVGTTGFAAGTATFDLFVARSFTASDTTGNAATITGNNGKLRTSYATTGISDYRAGNTAGLTAGTRTLDATPASSVVVPTPTAGDLTLLAPNTALFDGRVSEVPIILAQNEGFVVQATVPATGTWSFTGIACWDELASF